MKQLYLLALFGFLALSVFAQSYTTNPDRLESLQTLCVDQGLSRDTLLDEEAKARNQEYLAGMKASFTVDGNLLIRNVLQDTGSAVNELTGTATQLIIFVVPFIIGLVIIVLIWMFLCCCCVCPSCCPSKCCQKNEEQQYTKCELIWPTIVLILALLLSVVASIIGLTSSSDIETSFKATECALAVTFDDILNGNVSESGKFFAGISTVGIQLNKLNTNLGFVTNQLDQIDNDGPTITNIGTTYTAFESQLLVLPSGSSDTKHAPITYGPFISSGATTLSIMPDVLGRKSDTASSVGIIYKIATQTKNAVESTSDAAQAFKDGISSFSSGFGDVSKSVEDLQKTLDDTDSSLSGAMVSINSILGTITVVISALFGVIIGLAVLGIVGALIMTFCNKFKCRYLVYFACVILFIIGIVLFLLATIFALITPVLYYACQFLTYSTESEANFKQSLGSVLGDATDYIAVCLPGASGNLLDTIGGDITGSMNGLTDSMSGMKDFGNQQFSSAIDNAWVNVTDTIYNYYTGKTLDFVLPEGKNQLIKLANGSQWSSTCPAYASSGDSWVPTTWANPQITCVGSGANTTVCGGALACGSPACFDSQTVLQGKTLPGDIDSRYSGGSCTTFSADLKRVYDNYYAKKIAAAGYGDLLGRFSTSDTAQTNFANAVNAVQTAFQDVFGNLTATIDSVVDPEYGLIAGFNCVIFGEDFNRAIETICVKFFNTTYLARLTLGITAFGILFAMCCSVCAGVRHYKHSMRITKLDAFDGGNQESTMANLNQKY